MTHYPLTVFFDGACPICAREIALMKHGQAPTTGILRLLTAGL
jgi:predicted DCC family thiol-disulfide oxidoreductase YuxK